VQSFLCNKYFEEKNEQTRKMSEEKTEQLILKVEKKTIFFDKFRHDYRKEKRRMKAIAAHAVFPFFITISKF